MICIKTRLGSALAVVLLGGNLSTAQAGPCTKSLRAGVAFTQKAARTVVRNDTGAITILALLFRNSTEKWHKFVRPGEAADFTAHFTSDEGGAAITLQLYPDPGVKSTECKYRVEAGENNLKWNLPPGASEVCPDMGDMTIACDKSFNKDKARYTTTFTVGDPQ